MQYGATVEVRKTAGGPYLAPWPVDYLNWDGDTLVFWWIGSSNGTRPHYVKATKVEDRGDGIFAFTTSQGDVATLEPAWSPEQFEMLRNWRQLKASGQGQRNYDEGGWHYGQV